MKVEEERNMELQGLLIVCPLVFLAGFVDAIAGGGGIISLPAYLFAGIPPHMALGTNKLSSTSGTLISTIRYMKNGYLKGIGLLAALAAVAAIAGSAAGSRIALFVPEKIIENLMLIVLPVVAFFVLRNKSFFRGEGGTAASGKEKSLFDACSSVWESRVASALLTANFLLKPAAVSVPAAWLPL